MLVLGSVVVRAQDAPCPAATALETLERRLQSQIEGVLANSGVPSVLLHVESPSRCLSWSGAAGVFARGSTRKLSSSQTFRIASNTKTYTAAAVLRLMEKGKLRLDEPIARHLDQQFVQLLESGGYPADEITLLDLLTHTSGLFDHGATDGYFNAIMANPGRRWQRIEQLRFAVTEGHPYGSPGDVFHYSDTGYVLLGGVIARHTGKNLGLSLRELLAFDRLGLEETWMESMEPQPASASDRVHQYLGLTDTFSWDPSMDLYGGGGLVTSTGDLAAFVRALLEGRVLEKNSTLETMRTTQPVANSMNYRIGLDALDVDGRLGLGHTGFWNTFAYHFPDIDLTVAGSINQVQGPRGSRLAEAVVKELLAAGF